MLLDLSELILNHLNVIKEPEFVEDILEKMVGTPVEIHKPIYEYALWFLEQNEQYPTYSSIKDQFPDQVRHFPDGFHTDKYFQFINELEFEAIKREVLEALRIRDYPRIAKAVEILRFHKNSIPDYGVDEAVEAYYEMLKYPSGVKTGIKVIDDVLQGMTYGTLNVIAARPSHGKTTFGVSMLYHDVFIEGFNFILLTAEETKRALWFSFLSRHSYEMGKRILAEDLKKGMVAEDQLENLEEVKADWKKNCQGTLKIVEVGDLRTFSFIELNKLLNQIDTEIQNKSEGERRLDGILIDFIQQFGSTRPRGVQITDYLNDLVNYFAYLSRGFSERGLIIILLSQLNRQAERRLRRVPRPDERPPSGDATMLADLNSLERAAHTVIYLYADEEMRLGNRMRVQLFKNRSGRVMDSLESVFADFGHYVVGAEEFAGVFNSDASAILGDTDESESTLFA